jgi:predicted dehydrogenase/threonine dehydrogenase-like Zn-dependent dehydrogenase
MKVLLQHLDSGLTTIVDCPDPTNSPSRVIVIARCSLISAGTERMLKKFGRAGLWGKFVQAKDKISDVRAKVRANGLFETYTAVRAKLSQPIALGYALVGTVHWAPIGSGFSRGDRVVTNAHHGDVGQVPLHHCVSVPENVRDEVAAFTPLAAIALQGINLLEPCPGQKIMVVGLGLIGQLAARILVAKGCTVLGVDPSNERVELAVNHGVHPCDSKSGITRCALTWTNGLGVDGVIIAASSESSDLINSSALGCRDRARIISVGVVGLNLRRPIFFKSEVSIQVSHSYGAKHRLGAGSAHANFIEVLRLMSRGLLRVDDLISRRYDFADAASAYEELLANSGALGIVLKYNNTDSTIGQTTKRLSSRVGSVAIVGAGNFANRTLLPALRDIGATDLLLVASNQGHQALYTAQQFNISYASTDEAAAIENKLVQEVFLCTRHDAHARQAILALATNKSVWVEKPLALTLEQLSEVEAAARLSKGILMVGFNRRFAPITTLLRGALNNKQGKKELVITINAGNLERGHWILDPSSGGGRIVGEVCHFVDLARAFINRPILEISCLRRDTDGQDGGCFELLFLDGSKAVIDYRTDLPPDQPKENILVFGKSWSAEIHNWARMRSVGLGVSHGWHWSKAPKKGHREALRAFLAASRGRKPSPIPIDEIVEVSKAAIIMQSLSIGERISLSV